MGELNDDFFDHEVDQPMTKEAVLPQGVPKEFHWNKEGENRLRGTWKRVDFVTEKKEISDPKSRARRI